MTDASSPTRRFTRGRSLSDRERSGLEALAAGHSTVSASVELGLSPHTVRTYLETAMGKLEARTRVHAVAIALRRGEIEQVNETTATD